VGGHSGSQATTPLQDACQKGFNRATALAGVGGQ